MRITDKTICAYLIHLTMNANLTSGPECPPPWAADAVHFLPLAESLLPFMMSPRTLVTLIFL